MATLFVSDVHLDVPPFHQERTETFLRFLRGVDPARVERIIILGDLFDFWFEYKHVIFSGYFDVLRALAALRDHGVRFDLIGGNHDFWAGRFLEEQLGFCVHKEPFMMDFGGRRVLLMHGDGLNARDVGYRLYRRVARTGWVIRAFRLLHPDWAMALARFVSRGSRRLAQAPDPGKGSEAIALRAYARNVLAGGKADAVICGHAHSPIIEEYPAPVGNGLYINTGDWLFHCSYVEWDGTEFRLLNAR